MNETAPEIQARGVPLNATAAPPSRGGSGKLRLLGLLFTAILPQSLKRLVYRSIFKYRIAAGARVGIAVLDCRSLSLGENARIGHGAVFLQCGDVEIGRHAVIGALNVFRGGTRIELGDYSQVIRLNAINAIPDHDCTTDPDSTFILGYGAVVTSEHRVDFTDRVSIGRGSILGGRNSSIWTHNRRATKPVAIGNYCYVGSEIRMAPGASVPDCCVVGLGSVLIRPLTETFSLIAGNPGKVRRPLRPDDYELIFGKTRKDLPDETYPTPPPAAV